VTVLRKSRSVDVLFNWAVLGQALVNALALGSATEWPRTKRHLADNAADFVAPFAQQLILLPAVRQRTQNYAACDYCIVVKLCLLFNLHTVMLSVSAMNSFLPHLFTRMTHQYKLKLVKVHYFSYIVTDCFTMHGCSDVIVITYVHVGDLVYVNKNRIKCKNLTFLRPSHSQTMLFAWCVIYTKHVGLYL